MMKTFTVAMICLVFGGLIGAFVVWNGTTKPGGSASSGTTPDVQNVGVLEVVCSGRVSASGPEIPLQANVPGQVKAVHVKEGDYVTAQSSILFELDDKPYQLKVNGTKAALDGAKAALREVENEREKLPLLKAMREEAIAIAALNTDSAREVLKGLQDQADSNKQINLTSEIKLAEIKVKQSQILENNERKQLALLEQTDVTAKVDQAKAYVGQVHAEYQAALNALDECKIKAPTTGTVLQIFSGVGSQAAPGSPLPLAVMVPAGRLLVRAELDQEYLGKVVAGQMCKFKDETRADSSTWEGQVLQVGKQVRRARTFILEPGEINDVRTVEVVIEPKISSSKEELLIGQRVRVRFGKME